MSRAEKGIFLYHKEQSDMFENARKAVESEYGESVTDGDVVAELAAAYSGVDSPLTNGESP